MDKGGVNVESGKPGVTLTCLSPDREILILLNVQHDLQAVPRSSLIGDAWWLVRLT